MIENKQIAQVPSQSSPPFLATLTVRRGEVEAELTHITLLLLSQERKDAEGWETVQRGRPIRSRSTAVMPKVSLATEAARSKDDSDKENVCLLPNESIRKGEFVGDGSSDTIESHPKDSLHSCDHPLAEKTQDWCHFTVSTLDDVKNSGSIQDNYVRTSEISTVHIDTECVSVMQQANTPPLQVNEEKFPAEKARIENEMDPSDISNKSSLPSMAEVLAKKEELADRLEKANEEAIASAIAEEEQLTREIEAEENNDINIETDNDSDFSASMGSGSVSFCGMSMDWNDVLADYEARESWRQNTSWGDIVEEEPSRPPGHGIHMHEKLSSPSRKRTIAESKKKHEEKQMKAQQLREKLREEKTLKLQKLLEREKDVRKWKEELLDQRRRMMEEKLLHAEFKREVQLQAIVKKAQEEEAKDKFHPVTYGWKCSVSGSWGFLYEYLLHCPARLGGSLLAICLPWLRPAATGRRSTVVRFALLVESVMGTLTSEFCARCRCAAALAEPAVRAKTPAALASHNCETSTDLARIEATQAPGAPQKISKTVPSFDSLHPVTNPITSSRKLEEIDSKEQFSSFGCEDQKEVCAVSQDSRSNAAPDKGSGDLTALRTPCFSSPNVISFGPEQTGWALGDQGNVTGQGKKLFGSGNVAATLQHHRPTDPMPLPAEIPPVFPSGKSGPSTNSMSGGV
ncbi:hypothetical protein P7K49_017324 [Saguinus oedipus]|uniref:S phase cyclin A-associated protein in the endoplasmic reticulum n=1 Tax=Saguinus oedipus TaxID=9490 RepID=A0ABQ9V270_SAGOE|nr:hypothetical protein P7K49_017324 [Saguinus oedipus]